MTGSGHDSPHKYFAARHFAHITPAVLFVLCVTRDHLVNGEYANEREH